MNLRRYSLILTALIASAGYAAPFEGGYTETDIIGPGGDLSTLVIQGISAEQAAALRRAFARNPFVQRYASPSTPAYVLVDRLKAGAKEAFLQAGYKSVEVDLHRAADTLTMQVSAGNRYTAGEVRIEAPGEVDVAPLIAELTTRSMPSHQSVRIEDTDIVISLNTEIGNGDVQDPLWIPGDGARFDNECRSQIRKRIALGLFKQGFVSAQIESSHDVDDAMKTAALHVTVKNLGAKLHLAEVVIQGNKANSTAVIRQFLNIAEGQPVDLPAMQSAFEKLYKSGRFVRQMLTLHPVASGKAALAIDVDEVPGVPTLDQPLSDMEKAMLRFGDWASGFSEQPDDLVVDAAPRDAALFPPFRAIISPRDGSYFDLRINASEKETAPENITGLITRDSIALRTTADRHLLAAVRQLPVRLILQVVLTANSVNITTGFKTHSKADVPFTMQTIFHPAAFLALAHKKTSEVTLKDDTLTVIVGPMNIAVDAPTGRLRKVSPAGAASAVEFHAALVHDALAGEIEKFRAAPDPNVYDPKAPRASTLRFLAGALLRSALFNAEPTAEQRLAASEAMEQLMTPDLLAPLDAWTEAIPAQSTFTVNLTSREELVIGASESRGTFLLGHLIPPLYAYGSWPWTLQREWTLPFETQAIASELKRLSEDPALGPLGCLMAAECCGDNRERAEAFAKLGQQRLTATALNADIALLLKGDAPAPQFSRALLTHIRDLAPDRAQVLAKAVPGAIARPFYALYTALQARKGEPVEKAIPEIADTLFPILQPMLARRLASFVPAALPDFNLTAP